MRAAVLLIAMVAQAQNGRFYDGFSAENRGVGINIAIVHEGPRCKALANCSWMLFWSSKIKSREVEVAVTVAGMDSPVAVKVVPGKKDAPIDQHNPVFDIPLATVSAIDLTFRDGTQEVGAAHFQ